MLGFLGGDHLHLILELGAGCIECVRSVNVHQPGRSTLPFRALSSMIFFFFSE